MSNTILIKRSGTANSIPVAGDLSLGELAINYTDGNLFYKDAGGTVRTLTSTQFVSVAGNVTGSYIIGNGSQLTGVVATSVGTLASLSVTGNTDSGNLRTAGQVSATGNISGNYILGNGALLTGVITSVANINLGNSNVTVVSSGGNITVGVGGTSNVAVFATTGEYVTGVISATGNITGGNLNAAGLSLSGNVVSALQASSSIAAGTTISAVGNITGGNLVTVGAVSAASASVSGNVSVNGNVTSGNVITGGAVSAASVSVSANVRGGNLISAAAVSAASVSASANITGGNLISGALTQTVDFSVSGNIVGNLLPAANATQNLGSPTQLWKSLYLAGNTIFLNDQSFSSNATGIATANAFAAGNFNTAGAVSATGNVTGGNIVTAAAVSAASVSASGNITGGNVTTAGQVSAVSITASGVYGNVVTTQYASVFGSGGGANPYSIMQVRASDGVSGLGMQAYTGSGTLYGNTAINFALGEIRDKDVPTSLVTKATLDSTGLAVTGIVSASGNVTGGNLITAAAVSAASVSASGNITGGNLNAAGLSLSSNVVSALNLSSGLTAATTVVAVGNVTGGNVITAGAMSAASVSASGAILATGNITGGNLITSAAISAASVSASGNVTGGNVVTAAAVSAASVSASGNITGGNIVTGAAVSAVSVSASGNVTGGNVNTNTIVGTTTTIKSTGDLVLSATGNIDVNSRYINNLANPVQNQDAATKYYVDSVAQGLHTHDSCNAATTTTLETISGGTVTYNNGTSGVGATLTTTGSYTTIDGVTLSNGMRILVKNEANTAYNGIYDRTSSTVLTRSSDFDTTTEMAGGDFTFVTAGTQYDNTGWVMIDVVTTIGTSPVDWVQFSGAGTYTANTAAGLVLNGSVFSAKVDDTTTAFDGGGNIIVKASANLTTPNIGAATGTSLSVTGNIGGGNINTGGLSLTGNVLSVINSVSAINTTANIAGGNLNTGGILSATGNVSGGNVNAATGIFVAGVSVLTVNATVDGGTY